MLASQASDLDSITGAAASIAAPRVGAPIVPNGNLASDGVTSYLWDARDRLVGLSGAISANFEYDGIGRRRAKTIGGATTQFVYDGANFVQELSAGVPTANVLVGLGFDENFARTDISGTEGFLADGLGSTLALSDSSGTVRSSSTYAPFGGTSTSGIINSNPSQFTGRENDGTGLYYYRSRYHDPALARFISEDSIGFQGGINLHAYVQNAPTNYVDPLGTQPVPKPIPPPGPAPVVIPPWAPLLLFDVWLLEHDWREFQKLCEASGWEWCSPKSRRSSSKERKSRSDDNERQRCEEVRRECHERCWNEYQKGRRTDIHYYFRCMTNCLNEAGCGNYGGPW